MEAYLDPRVRGLESSPTVAINERSDALRRGGRNICKLGLGQSPFPVPPSVVEALRVNAACKDYLPVRGLAALREAVAAYHRRSIGMAATAEDVIIGPGSKELLFLLQIVFDGELIVPTPAWVSYAPQARICGRRVTYLHSRFEDGWKLTPSLLDTHCRTHDGPRVLILNYPSNPTGCTYTADELADLAETARRYRVIVLSDEIYGEIHHRGEHASIARAYPEGTIVSSGLSKWCGAGGWRLGTFTFPSALRPLLDAIASVASETYTSTSAPIQFAAITAFQGGIEIERYLARARRILGALGGAVTERLVRAGARVAPPDGAFYVFPDFGPLSERLRRRAIDTSDELCARLLEETGVAILPGAPFGRSPEELTARLAWVDFDGPKAMAAVEAGAQIDPAFLDRHCGAVLEAVDRIAAWLGAT
jgi:aspartate aminotransferase